jgi:hypothetical protein
VDATFLVIALLSALLFSSCGTPEQNAWLGGVSQSDVVAISRAIHAKTSQQILSYQRQLDGKIFVEVRSRDSYPDIYVATRIDGKWEVANNVIVL